ncbi:MAG: ribokinase [Planctomycetota bacterium]
MPQIINVGSLNIDRVYRVPNIVRPGETLAASGFRVFAGGKGLNQSVAAARAGAGVRHAGCVGADGRWLLERLEQAGVDTACVRVDGARATGCAVIQVADDGENAIVIDAGTNAEVTPNDLEEAFGSAESGDVLLLQNEINANAAAMAAARRAGLGIALNPAPMTGAIKGLPLEAVDLLIVNETEADELGDAVHRAGRDVGGAVLTTLGKDGAVYRRGDEEIRVPAHEVEAVDTTAAGDTFIGYFLASWIENADVKTALQRATRAAAWCVQRHGAMDSIPREDQLGFG